MPYTTSDAAEEGKLMHTAMERAGSRLPLPKLTDAQMYDVETARAEGHALYNRIFSPEDPVPTVMREKHGRCYLVPGEVDLRYQIDVVVLCPAVKVLVIDWKFGRVEERPAEESPQMRGYAVIAAQEWKVETVVVAIVQPRADRDHRTTVCEYGSAELAQARQELIDLASKIHSSRGVHTPSPEGCKYCKVAGTEKCPESQQALVQMSNPGVMPTGAELGRRLLLAEIAENVIDAYRTFARQELEAGHEIPGWTLEQSAPVRSVPDAAKAWLAAQSVLPAAAFIGACKVGVGDIEKAVRATTNCTWKDAKAKTNAILGDAIVVQERKPSLKRTK